MVLTRFAVTTTTPFLCTLPEAELLVKPLISITHSCFEKGVGAHVWDPEGNEYLDFLSAYS